jgi:hypothetical protein
MENQTQQVEETQVQENQQIPNRRERRYRLKQQGVLKYLSKLSFLNPVAVNYRAENLKVGQRIQDILRERNEKQWEETFMDKLEKMKETWYEIGYNAEEITMLEEASAIHFAKNKATYREDKKEAKELIKKANLGLASRK